MSKKSSVSVTQRRGGGRSRKREPSDAHNATKSSVKSNKRRIISGRVKREGRGVKIFEKTNRIRDEKIRACQKGLLSA